MYPKSQGDPAKIESNIDITNTNQFVHQKVTPLLIHVGINISFERCEWMIPQPILRYRLNIYPNDFRSERESGLAAVLKLLALGAILTVKYILF